MNFSQKEIRKYIENHYEINYNIIMYVEVTSILEVLKLPGNFSIEYYDKDDKYKYKRSEAIFKKEILE